MKNGWCAAYDRHWRSGSRSPGTRWSAARPTRLGNGSSRHSDGAAVRVAGPSGYRVECTGAMLRPLLCPSRPCYAPVVRSRGRGLTRRV